MAGCNLLGFALRTADYKEVSTSNPIF